MMMNGEVPSVPITTLSGIASLTDLLTELPLPSPLPPTFNKSLFSSPELAEEAAKLLSTQDENLLPQLIHALGQANTDCIELKDMVQEVDIDGSAPPLLQAILSRDPNIFSRSRRLDQRSSSPRQPMAPAPHIQQQSSGGGYRGHLGPHNNSSSPGRGAASPGRFPQGSPGRASLGNPYPGQRANVFGSHGSPVPVNGLPNMQTTASPSVPQSSHNIPHQIGTARIPPSSAASDGGSAPSTPLSPSAQSGIPGKRKSKKKHQDGQDRNRDSSEGEKRHSQSDADPGAGAGDTSSTSRSEKHSKKKKRSKSHREDKEKDVKYVISSPLNPTKITIKLQRPAEKPPEPAKTVAEPEEKAEEVPEPPTEISPPRTLRERKKSTEPETSENGEHTEKKEVMPRPAIKIRIARDTETTKKDEEAPPPPSLPPPPIPADEGVPDASSVKSGSTPTPVVVLEKLKISPEMEESHPSGRNLRARKRTRSGTMKESEASMSPQQDDEELEEEEEEKPKTPPPPPPIFISREDSEEEAEQEGETAPRKKQKIKASEAAEIEEPSVDNEELLESATFKRFNTALESVFSISEEMEVSVEDDDEDEDECSPDLLISKSLLHDLVSEAAKLKSMSVMHQLPKEKLVRLLNMLERNIRDGTKLQPDSKKEGKYREQKAWKRHTMERITHSVDSALTAAYIMTASNMPKEVFIEDVIDRIAQLTKYQLQYSIYPEFDPVYRADRDTKGEGFVTHMKLKRARAGATKEKEILSLYNKLCTLVSNLSELMSVQVLTDSTVLLISSLGTAPFFVENVSELQLNALKLISTVFSQYEKHRQLILEDIFASLARLPSSKKNLRNFKLNSEDAIQMVTALVLQLIQCVVVLPTEKEREKPNEDEYDDVDAPVVDSTDNGVLVVNAYETAVRTGQNFLSVFLKKCVSKDEEDYRPLFENFVQDLLSAVNKPEWPAAELLLSLLGRLLMHHFSNKSNDMTMRVSSLEYLGQIASRLRKDAVSSRMDQDVLNTISKEMLSNSGDDGKETADPESERYLRSLERALLDYLVYNSENDPALLFTRQFYIAQWYRDTSAEMENAMKAAKDEEKEDSDDEEDEDESSEDEEDSRRSRRNRNKKKKKQKPQGSSNTELFNKAEKRKAYLLGAIKIFENFRGLRKSRNIITYESACLVARYLASKRPFSQSFDIYLSQILRVLSETAVAIRTRAMKCLSSVVAADTNILARNDVQKAVYGRFIDQSTSVREAAVELVGRFVLMEAALTDKYYDMLMERILDTGISVRKRVIKTLRDICIEQPNYSKIPEICVKIIRRVNDEEGIKRLVNETFQKMWFTPLSSSERNGLLNRALNVIEVVAASKDTGYDWLEQLLTNLLKSEEDASSKPVQKACVQITDCLVEHVLRLETQAAESTDEASASSRRLVSCLQTLFLFSKVKPELMVTHATTLQPYLSTKCSTPGDLLVVYNTARILELVVPLMDHPSEVFLANLEEDMMRLIIKHGQMVVQSCVSCLGAIVNQVTKNYKLVRDCFQKYYGVLAKYQKEHERDPTNQVLVNNKPTLRRALFTVGLFCKHFDFDAGLKNAKVQCISSQQSQMLVSERVRDVLLYFCGHEDEDIKLKALNGIGFLCNRYADFQLTQSIKSLYYSILEDPEPCIPLLTMVLRNLQLYLSEEDEKMRKADAEWKKTGKKEDLKEMGDVQSGMSSSVIQVYLKLVMGVMLHALPSIRMDALKVIILTLKQGLVHPVQCVPYLVAMGADSEAAIRVKADQQLSDIDSRYPGFIQMKSQAGVRKAFELQNLIVKQSAAPVRGIKETDGSITSLCAHLYSLIRVNRSHRRAFLTSLLNLFDEQAKTEMSLLVFVADNISAFSYQMIDEPLFIMHQIEIIVSVAGGNLLQSFKESLLPKDWSKTSRRSQPIDDSDDEEEDEIVERIPADATPLLDWCVACQACLVLLVLKQHLKELYGFRDGTIQRYSPTEVAKVYDKPVHRKQDIKFNPARALDMIKTGRPELPLSDKQKKEIAEEYLDFKQLMELMDPADSDEEDDTKPAPRPDSAHSSNPGEKPVITNGEKKDDGPEEKSENVQEEEEKKEETPKQAKKTKREVVKDEDEDSDMEDYVTPRKRELRSRSSKSEVKYKEDDSDDGSNATSPSTVSHSSKGTSRGRTPSRSKGRGKPQKPKPSSASKSRKKKRRRLDSSSEEDSSDDSDPDFV
ncbi:Nipped-B-like protein [Holothuria leucospilota]|uniref:Nipped-B protein n=1 Tax=Holothuria leucospilota TaxID=206669 RepID=A0A9Q1HCD2_HOLLE|nr:Nipped-B-like protein [Holothuria leucospilota]